MKCVFKSLAIMAVLASSVMTEQTQAEEGIYARYDALFLAPKLSSASIGNIFFYDDAPSITDHDGTVESELDYAHRLAVGYEGDQCGGFQVQWFSFDNTLPYQGIVNEGPTNFPLAGGLNIDVDAIDFELTQRGQFRVWDWLATAGARYARASIRSEGIDFSGLTDTIWFGSTGVQFEGAGPTVSLSGERGVLREGLSIFARGRTSLLFGETDAFSFARAGGNYTIADDFVQVTEIQIGTQCKAEFQEFDLDLSIFWEAQRWDSDSNTLGNLAFHGFGVRTGFTY